MPVMERIPRSAKTRKGEGERADRSAGQAQSFQQERRQLQLGNQATLRKLAAKKRQAGKPPAQEPDTPEGQADQVVGRFEADPLDQSGRTRADLNGMPPKQRGEVMGRVKDKTTETQFNRFAQATAEPGPQSPGTPPKEVKAGEVPEELPAPGPAKEVPAGEGPEGQKAPPEDRKEARPAETRGTEAAPSGEVPAGEGPKGQKAQPEDKKEARPAEAGGREAAPAEEPSTQPEKKAGDKDEKAPEGEKKKDKAGPAGPQAKKADTTKGEKPEAQKKVETTRADKAEGEAEAGKAKKANPNLPAEQAKQASANATEPGQAQAAQALSDMPAGSKGPGAQAPAAPGAPARQAAAQAGPAVEAAGGGGGGGGEGGGGGAEAALEEGGGGGAESPEQQAAGEKTEEKMAGAEEPEPEEKEEKEPPEPEPQPKPESEGGEGPGQKPSPEDEETIKEAERERQEQTRSPEGAAAQPASDEAEPEASPAEGAQVNPAEARAGIESLAEGAGGGAEPSGGGGGGGGGAISEQPEPAPPKVESLSPVGAMGAVGALKVGQISQSITGIQSSVSGKMSGERSTLTANAPSMERPSGAPQTRQGPIQMPEGAEGAEGKVEETAPGEAIAVEEPAPLRDPGPAPTDDVAAPAIQGGGEGGSLSEADAQNVTTAVDEMPTSDSALNQTAGPAPTVELAGDADPRQAADQRAAFDQTVAAQQQQGAHDVAQPMGEGEIYPVVPRETLKANIPAEGGGGGGGTAPPVDDETAALVAEEKQGDEVRASTQQASADMQSGEEEQATKTEEAKAGHETQVQELEAENAAQQSGERSAAAGEVQQLRGKWSQGQQQAVDKAHGDADGAQSTMSGEVQSQKQQGDLKASGEIEKANTDAGALREKAQTEASQKKAAAKQESSGGVLGWIASKATAFFEGLKKAVSAVFDFFRKALKTLIDGAKKLAVAAIDLARDAIVGAIKLAGKAIMAVGDVVLAAFPEQRARFRGFIEEKVKAAEDTVNKLADGLKAGINKLLDLLGSALNGLLNLLEKAYKAAIDVVAAAVQGAIKAAQAVIALVGLLASVIKDVAAGPGKWIRNLGAAVVDGIKNHLWKAFKAAVKNWFMSKLEEVLGLGMTIFNVLFKGGIKLAEIGKMAFEGLKAAIPTALIGVLVEKLVAMIVPAAGAVMVIIESLQAAWGTISRILQAIDRFVAFLKAIKSGTAGPKFAEAVAAAAIGVIDFVANWLIKRIRGPASKIGGKIKAIAKKILEKLKAIAKKIGAAVKKAFKKIAGKIKGAYKKVKEKLFGKKKKNKRGQDKAKERLEKAVRELRPRLQSMLTKPVSGIALRAKLAFWRLRYRIKGLTLSKSGQRASIQASNSPAVEIVTAIQQNRELVMKVIREAGHTIISDPKVQGLAKRILEARKAGFGTTRTEPLQMTGNIPAAATELGAAGVPPFRRTRMETTVGGIIVPLSERTLFRAGAPGTVVGGLGATGNVSSIISDLGGPKAVARDMTSMQTGAPLTSGMSGPERVSKLAAVNRLQGVEAARDLVGEVPRATMRLSEAARGRLTAAEMKGAVDPIGGKGGTGTAGHISREMGFDAPGKRTPTKSEIDTFIGQELDLAARFVESAARDEKVGGTVLDIEHFIKKQLKDMLISLMRQKYGL
jgi:hypothetical protein